MTGLPWFPILTVPGVSAVLAWMPGILQSEEATAPLPAQPPIGGVTWTVVIPAFLFIGSFLGTYLLYRRFSKVED